MEEEMTTSKSVCCCCCKRPKRSINTDKDKLNGEKITSHTDTLLPTVEQNLSNSNSFQSQDQPVHPGQTKYKRCSRACLKCCKKFTTFFFSNIGLCSLVVAYSILGGFIFQTLEAPYEIEKRHYVTAKRASYAKAIWNLTQSGTFFFEPNLTRDAETILIAFQNEVLAATKKGWDGTDGDVEPQWSFPGALLYSVTVITTIGYGHIAPKTMYGRLVTIFYALVGIPLMLLCLANMGAFLGDCFRLVYKHTCRLLTWLCCPPEDSFTKKKGSTPPRSTHSPELDPLQTKGSTTNLDKLEADPIRIKRTPSKLAVSAGGSHSGSRSEINIVVEDFDHPKTKHKEVIRVPIFVSIVIIALYIFGGALMFSVWEDWDYLEGSYFCFITLSTVGFGDYVPGSIGRTDSVSSRQKLIICCVYLMFGLSIIAMCFNLMQEDVRAKFVWLGEQVGLIDKKT